MPLLRDAGHSVTGVIRNPEHEHDIEASGGKPLLLDVETALEEDLVRARTRALPSATPATPLRSGQGCGGRSSAFLRARLDDSRSRHPHPRETNRNHRPRRGASREGGSPDEKPFWPILWGTSINVCGYEFGCRHQSRCPSGPVCRAPVTEEPRRNGARRNPILAGPAVSWGVRGSNPRPRDYESLALTG